MRLIKLADYYQIKWLVLVLLEELVGYITSGRFTLTPTFNNHVKDLFIFSLTSDEYEGEFNSLLVWFYYNQCALAGVSEALIDSGDKEVMKAVLAYSGAPLMNRKDWRKKNGEDLYVYCYTRGETIWVDHVEKYSRRYM
jgi:hypothetical protein